MTRLAIMIALVALIFSFGCAGLSGGPDGSSEPFKGRMTQTRMELLFAAHVEAIMGPPGAIQTRVDGINIYLISDPARDRMRIMAPVARMNPANPRLAPLLLQANFQNTLDARYAVSDDLIYALYLHPLSSLTPELIESGLAQVVSLGKTFGSTFSSDQYQFGPRPEVDR
jgi:hypothetical protein